MKNLSITPNHAFIILLSSLLLNFLFFVTYMHYDFTGLIAEHGEIGFNLYHENSIKVSSVRLKEVFEIQNSELRLVDPIEINKEAEGPKKFRSVNDTIGYGVLLGLLWKVTGSLKYRDVQILQIILFSLALLLLYKISLLLFGSNRIAFYSCLAQLLFFPLIFLNIHPLRDIWSYYGILLLLYGVLRCTNEKEYDWITVLSGVGFVVCQWMRPTIVFTLLAVLIPLVVWRKEALKGWSIFLVLNLLLFWLPFCCYNKIAYNRYFVSTVGQDLYEGLGEYPNSWNIKMNDSWCAQLIYDKYGLAYGTPEYQDKALQLFLEAVKERPLEYIGQLCVRLHRLIAFSANWPFEYTYFNFLEKIPYIGHPLFLLLKLIGYILIKFQYIRLYLVGGWLSALFFIFRKNYFAPLLLIVTALSCSSKFPSQLDPRYLVPYFSIFSLLIGYSFCLLCEKIRFYKKVGAEKAISLPV